MVWRGNTKVNSGPGNTAPHARTRRQPQAGPNWWIVCKQETDNVFHAFRFARQPPTIGARRPGCFQLLRTGTSGCGIILRTGIIRNLWNQPSLTLPSLWPHRSAHHRASHADSIGAGGRETGISSAIDCLARALGEFRPLQLVLWFLRIPRALGGSLFRPTLGRPSPGCLQ